MKGLFVIHVESRIVSSIAFGQEPLRVEDPRFDPILGGVLDVLEIYADDAL